MPGDARQISGKVARKPTTASTTMAWSRLVLRLTEPSSALPDPEERWRARLLAAILLAIMPLMALGALVFLIRRGEAPVEQILGLCLSLAAYFLSRGAWPTVAAVFGILGSVVPTFILVLIRSHQTSISVEHAFYWLAHAAVFSSLVLPLGRALFANGLLMVGALVLAVFAPAPIDFGRPFSVLIVLMILTSIAAWALHLSRRELYAEVRERERAEAALHQINEELEARVAERTNEVRKKSEQLEAVMSSSPAAVIMLDPNGRVAFWNAAATRIFGWHADEVLGQQNPVLPIGPGQTSEQPFGLTKPLQGKANAEFTARTKKGRPIEVSLSCASLFDAKYRPMGVVGVLLDISERRQLELEMRHGQKMEAVGRLAGGVAHDFNNLLTVISGSTELLLDMLPPESEERTIATELRDAEQRAAALTRQLLAFSRREAQNKETLNLNQVIEGLSKMLKRLLDPNVTLALELDASLGNIVADRGHIEQVLMNLAVNANDAMPSGGQLTISTSNSSYSPAESKSGVMIPSAVAVVVSDNGVGMTPDVRDRVFEPFFTTKSADKGTGLGLATVYGIVKQSGGMITLASKVGQGTTFRLYFPRVDAPLSEKRPEAALAAKGHATILVVEDMESVRRLTVRMLEHLGYRTLTAPSGNDAIELFRQRQSDVDLVLTDVVMPGLDGPECVRQLRHMRPGLPAILMSGNAERASASLANLDNAAFLRKPFTKNELASELKRALAASTIQEAARQSTVDS